MTSHNQPLVTALSDQNMSLITNEDEDEDEEDELVFTRSSAAKTWLSFLA